MTRTTSEQAEQTGAKDKWELSALMEELQNHISLYLNAQWGKTQTVQLANRKCTQLSNAKIL